MYLYKNDYYIFTDDYYKFLLDETAGFLTTPTGTALFKGVAPFQITADHENSDFPITNAADIDDQFNEYLSTDTTETIIEVTFLGGIDTLFLANINFSEFDITVNGVDSTITAFQDQDTGRYNGICFFDGDVTSLTITITAQTPTDGTSYFSIGSIVGGNKVTLNPRYQAGRTIVQPSEALQFDRNNKEVNNSARPYHLFTINFKDLLTVAEIATLRQLERSVGMDNIIIVYENYDDRETGILGERIGAFDYSEKGNLQYDSLLNIKEKV